MKLISRIHGGRYAGATLTMPVLGDVSFTTDGELAIPKGTDPKVIQEFIQATRESFDFYDPYNLTEEDEAKREETEQLKAYKANLSELSEKDLLELAVEAGIPGDELQSMTNQKIINEIAQKIFLENKGSGLTDESV